MLKFASLSILPVMGAAAVMIPAAQAVPLGPHAATCAANGSAVLVHVEGFRERTGNLRVQLYASEPSTFLEKGKYLARVDVPVTRSGPMEVCVPVAKPGNYAVSVRHDANGNGKSDRSDGGGFSGNPKVGLTDLAFKRKPSLAKVSFSVSGATRQVNVILNYVQGLSFGPISDR